MLTTPTLLPQVALLLPLLARQVGSRFVLPPLNDKLYTQEGDLIIGGIFSITERDPVNPCSDRVVDFFRIDLVESMVFSIREINQILLPELNIGFVVADACNKETTAALQALRFLPKPHEDDDIPIITMNKTSAKGEHILSNEVIGVIGTDASFTTVPAALVMSTAHIPIISFRATSDVLSDQDMFPNFYRVVAPDKALLRAIAEFIREKGWYYFSIVYDNDDQFQSLREQLSVVMSDVSVCLDESIKVSEGSDFAEVLTQLVSGRCRSRIIVVLTSDHICKVINNEVNRMGLNRKLFWFGADTWMQLIFDERAPSGSVGVSYTGTSRPVENYIEHLTGLYGRTKNPWFPAAMRYFNCNSEESYRMMVRSHYHENPALTSLTYSAIYVLLHALKQFLGLHGCNVKNSLAVVDCFHEHEEGFSAFFKNVSTHDKLGGGRLFHHDHRGSGRFSFYQLVPDKRKKLLDLSHYDLAELTMQHAHEIDAGPLDFSMEYFHPLRFCTPSCGFDEHRAYVTQCCWRCRRCQESEIVSESGAYCEDCPRLYWPAPAENNKSVCMEIDPDFYTLSNPLCGFLFFLTVVGALLALAVLVWYVINRDNNLVKASSVELNYVHLVTFLASYSSVPLFLMEPTHTNCTLGVLLFTVSFNISYMIMLMKAVRVYRIFSRAGKAMKVAYISPTFHVAFCFGFLAAEIIRFLIVAHFFPIQSSVYQPEYNVKYVEKACSIPPFHMLLFVVLDFVLLLLCSLFAFKTQTLPSRFKESRFVSTCVLTTLIIWSAFLPAYFTTVYHKTRAVYIVFTVLINNNMALFLIFVSRLVLVEYLKGDGPLFRVVSYLCFCEKN